MFSTGFLTEGTDVTQQWLSLIDQLYPDNPVYRVTWGAKALKDLGFYFSKSAVGPLMKHQVGKFGKRALRIAGKKLSPIGWVMGIPGVIGNPWHSARVKADQVALSLAVVLKNVQTNEFILMGHSLGGRMMTRTAEALGRDKTNKIVDMHLFGAAVGAKHDWSSLNHAVSGMVKNYYSKKDRVLAHLYRSAEFTQRAAGFEGFVGAPAEVINIDVLDVVGNHSAYIASVRLHGPEFGASMDVEAN